MINNCYNGTGVNADFFKTLVKNRKNVFDYDLKLPKPNNIAEFNLLSKFIFGVELIVDFNDFFDHLNLYFKNDDKLARKIKLYNINNNKNYIEKGIKINHYYVPDRNNKIVLLSFKYNCKNKHSEYYDAEFNNYVFHMSYEAESKFFHHVLGSGGWYSLCSGGSDVTTFDEYYRLKNMIKNNHQIVSESFKNEIDKLIKMNDDYNKKRITI